MERLKLLQRKLGRLSYQPSVVANLALVRLSYGHWGQLSYILYVTVILIHKIKTKSLIIKKSKVIRKLIYKPYFLF